MLWAIASIILFFLIVVKGLTLILSWNHGRHKSKLPSHNILQDAIRTLASSTLHDRISIPANKSIEALFQVRNPFVSCSPAFKQHWRQTLLLHFLHTNAGDWTDIATAASSAFLPLIDTLQREGSQETYTRIAVQDVSRDVTLAAVLRALFGLDNIPSATLTYVGKEVQDLFLAKKAFDASCRPVEDIPLSLRKRTDDLIATLRTLLTSSSMDSDSGSPSSSCSSLVKALLCTSFDDVHEGQAFNPLSLIIPAFESSWRVVFYTLLATLQPSSATSSPISDHHQYILALRNHRPHDKPSPVVQAIISETLRLYPPVRRLRRRRTSSSDPDSYAVIDIERIHRDEQYWGSDALDFRPSRFLADDGTFKVPGLVGSGSGSGGKDQSDAGEAWMPFAAGSVRCPSAKGYAVRMVATAVGEVMRGVFAGDDNGEQRMVWRWWWEGLDEERPIVDETYGDHKAEDVSSKSRVLKAGRDEYGRVALCVARI